MENQIEIRHDRVTQKFLILEFHRSQIRSVLMVDSRERAERIKEKMEKMGAMKIIKNNVN